MEKYAELISILLQHSQRFLDFWNFQIVVSLGVLGFALANQEVVSKMRVRVLLTVVFTLIALFTTFSLSVHQQREEMLWTALEARVAAAPSEFIPEEVAYLNALKPTGFVTKASAVVAADVVVILVIWFSPQAKEKVRPVKEEQPI